jgi:hypothetical protein
LDVIFIIIQLNAETGRQEHFTTHIIFIWYKMQIMHAGFGDPKVGGELGGDPPVKKTLLKTQHKLATRIVSKDHLPLV